MKIFFVNIYPPCYSFCIILSGRRLMDFHGDGTSQESLLLTLFIDSWLMEVCRVLFIKLFGSRWRLWRLNLWLLIHNALLTGERLRNRHVISFQLCSFCNTVEDSSSHIFLDCLFIQFFWDFFSKSFDFSVRSFSISDWWLDWRVSSIKWGELLIWDILMMAFVRIIWRKYNDRLFNSPVSSHSKLLFLSPVLFLFCQEIFSFLWRGDYLLIFCSKMRWIMFLLWISYQRTFCLLPLLFCLLCLRLCLWLFLWRLRILLWSTLWVLLQMYEDLVGLMLDVQGGGYLQGVGSERVDCTTGLVVCLSHRLILWTVVLFYFALSLPRAWSCFC